MIKTPIFANMTVLVADESSFSRRIVRTMLEQTGIRQVVEAADGVDALNRLTQIRPGLIVMDWALGGVSGLGVLKILRDPSRAQETSTPIIVMSSAPTRRMVEQAAEFQVRHVLRKPFAPKRLWQRILEYYPEIEPVHDRLGGFHAIAP